MTVGVCPNGHDSEEPDYCSVCGAPMGQPAEAGVTPAGPPASAGPACPSCGTPREDLTARFCEVCRYDYEAGTPGPPPVAADPPAAAPAAAASGAGGWEVVVTVDSTLDVEPDPSTPPPTDAGDRVFPVDLPEMLIGRRDDRHDIRPEIPLQDPAVSRRHAKLIRAADGGLVLLDLASANGTALNGAEIEAGVRTVLADGDAITLGRWTKIVVHRRT